MQPRACGTFRLLVPLVLMALALPLPAAAQSCYAFIVVIDGIRNDEGFEAESTYLGHVWNDLRPLGTINRKFWNRGWTETTAAHASILSGTRQIYTNNIDVEQHLRSSDPLLFECFRRYLARPESACGVIVGKWANCGEVSDFALEPSFGEPYRGFRLRQSDEDTDDTCCSRLVHQAMDSLHPELMLVNLGEVDAVGHLGVFGDYVQAIRQADSIVWEFWRHIQAEPPWTDTFYRDRTVLIVTADHGRNDDGHLGFANHGQWDHGCRDLILLALGPGIARNRVIDTIPRDQIDITPTLGHLLGIPTPFAQGDVMTELFEDSYLPPKSPAPRFPGVDADNLSNNPGFSRDPDICRDRYGNLHLVWSDNTPGKWSIVYRRSADGGITWSPARQLFSFPGCDSVMCYARVAADDSVIVGATGWGKHASRIDSLNPGRLDTTFLWYPWIATSTNCGLQWSTVSLMDSNMGTYPPAVSVNRGHYAIAWAACGKFAWETTFDGTNVNHRFGAGRWDSLPASISRKETMRLSMVDDGIRHHVAAGHLRGSDWDIAYAWSCSMDTWTLEYVVEDPDGNPVYDCDPEIAVDDSGTAHLFWARKPDVGSVWRLYYGRRDPLTGAWDTTAFTGPASDAWQPHLAVKGDTVAVVWTDFRHGNSEVYSCFSPDLGHTWTEQRRVTYSEGFSQRPRVCQRRRGFYVTWQEYVDNWDIHGHQLDAASGIGRDEGRSALRLPTVIHRTLMLPDDAAGSGSNPTPASSWALLDASGRRVADLWPGANDVRHLAPGVYFLSPLVPQSSGRIVLVH